MQWMFRQTIQHKMQDNAEQDCDPCLPVSAVYACLSVFCYLQTCHSCITTPVWTVWRQQWHEVPVIWRWHAHRRKASVCGAAGGIVSQVWWTWTSVFSYSRVQSHHWPECQWWQLHSWYVCVCDWSVSFRHSVSYSWNVVGRRHVPRRSVDQHSVSAAHDNEEAPPPKLECSVAWILQWSIGSLSCRTQICSISATSSGPAQEAVLPVSLMISSSPPAHWCSPPAVSCCWLSVQHANTTADNCQFKFTAWWQFLNMFSHSTLTMFSWICASCLADGTAATSL